MRTRIGPYNYDKVSKPFDFKQFLHTQGFSSDPLDNLKHSRPDGYKLRIHNNSSSTNLKILIGRSVIYNGLKPYDADQSFILFKLLKII